MRKPLSPAQFRKVATTAVPAEAIKYQSEFFSGGYKVIHIYLRYDVWSMVYITYRAGIVEVDTDVRILAHSYSPHEAEQLSLALSYAGDICKAIASVAG